MGGRRHRAASHARATNTAMAADRRCPTLALLGDPKEARAAAAAGLDRPSCRGSRAVAAEGGA
ncbi:hypothetical protein GGD65_004069 [Bradyrhizobium sp. CIR18]|nr:hypothetical protein [Bradyrhizobium sp. CIR18]